MASSGAGARQPVCSRMGLDIAWGWLQAQLALWNYDDFRASPLAVLPTAAPSKAAHAQLVVQSACSVRMMHLDWPHVRGGLDGGPVMKHD